MKRHHLFFDCIIRELEYLRIQLSNVSFEEFQRNGTVQRAWTRSLEIIGQATKDLLSTTTIDLKEKYPSEHWQIVKMRDLLAKQYHRISEEIVWDTVNNDIPSFALFIQDVYVREFNDSK